MLGLLGYMAGGMAKGMGDAMVKEGLAKREAALKMLDYTLNLDREERSRAFTRERDLMQIGENEKDRIAKGDLIRNNDGSAGRLVGTEIMPIKTSDGSPLMMPKDRKEEQALFEQEQKLRKEYNDNDPVKQYSTIRDSYERVRASAQRAAEDTTGASDMSMIFNYMKMLDPGSVVRETEFENAARSGGYGSRIQNLVQQITSGKMLTPAQRKEFVATADKLYSEAAANVESANERYGPIADQYSIARDRVIMAPEKYDPIYQDEKDTTTRMKLDVGGSMEISPGITIRRTK